jgi:hypothetical protein
LGQLFHGLVAVPQIPIASVRMNMEERRMKKRKQISSDEARRIGESLNIDWEQVDLEQFRRDLMGNQTQEAVDPETGLTYDGVLLSGKIVMAHMQDFPDYFTRLEKLKTEADEYHSGRR